MTEWSFYSHHKIFNEISVIFKHYSILFGSIKNSFMQAASLESFVNLLPYAIETKDLGRLLVSNNDLWIETS
jgi:hypothetical protein